MIGRTVSHYKILEKIDEGGMGVVYKAEDTRLKRIVALKFLLPQLTLNSEVKERFIHEAQAASALSHHNICSIHDIDETSDGQIFMVMDCYEGETLKQKIEHGPLSIEDALNIAVQTAEGLSRAHEKGIVHRDVKPANIFITRDGVVKILDFGLAKLAGQTRLTKTGTTIGTVAYMSPEQIRGEQVDHRTDIWSLGVVFYEMLTGRLAFKGEYEQAVIYMILNEDPEPLPSLNTAYAPELTTVIKYMLEKNPADRCRSMNDFINDLRSLKDKTGGQAEYKPKVNRKIRIRTIKELITIRLFLLVFAASTFVFALYYFNFLSIKPKVSKSAIHHQITFTGEAKLPRISPDGKFLAYVSREDSAGEKVMIQDMSGGQPIEVFKEFWITDVRWSPDGSQVLITSSDWRGWSSGSILPRLGGAGRRYPLWRCFASWAPDGSHFAAAGYYPDKIYYIQKDTGDTSSTRIQKSFNWLEDLDWSPAGDVLAFQARDEYQLSIWTISINGKYQTCIVKDSLGVYSPRWNHNGDALYYLCNNGQTFDLMKIDVPTAGGKMPLREKILQTGLPAGGSFSLTQDDKILFYERAQQNSNLWILDRTQNYQTPGLKRQLTTGTAFIRSASISPDAEKIAFSKKVGTAENIYTMPLHGGPAVQLTFFKSSNIQPAWSPDGQEIAFISTENRKKRIWIVPANGGTPRVFENSRPGNQPLEWAPGADVLYGLPSEKNFIRLEPKSGTEKTLVEKEGVGTMYCPQYSPDGNTVAIWWYRSERKRGLWTVSLEDTTKIFIQEGGLMPIQWSYDEESIYCWDGSKNFLDIFRIPSNGGVPVKITRLPGKNQRGDAVVSMTPDEHIFLYSIIEIQSDVWAMENFESDVR